VPMSMKERSALGVAKRNVIRARDRFRRYADDMAASDTAPDEQTQAVLATLMRSWGWEVNPSR
jgi:hypothetical protein